MARTCPSCRAPVNDDDAAFCPACGQRLALRFDLEKREDAARPVPGRVPGASRPDTTTGPVLGLGDLAT